MDERSNGAAVAALSSPGGVLRLIREGRARTRNELMQVTGMSRSTVLQRVGVLLASGLVREVGDAPSAGGRPPTLLTFNEDAGVVAAVDLGARHGRVAVTDLGGRALATAITDLRIADGPD